MINIEIINPVECRISAGDYLKIKPIFQFKREYWSKGRYSRTRHEYQKTILFRNPSTKDPYGYFYKGNLPYIIKQSGVDFKVIKNYSNIEPETEAHLPGIQFREDQITLIDKAWKRCFGIIVSPTGSGKTILMMGIISMYPSARVLILAHTKDIVQQTFDELQKFQFSDLQIIEGSRSKELTGKIIVSTIQSFVKIDPKKYSDRFEMVIVDESHRVSTFNGIHGKVLSKVLAPLRFGFTATHPTNTEAKLASEGLIGPVLGRLSINEAVSHKILAKPKIRLLKVPYNQKIKDERSYGKTFRNYRDESGKELRVLQLEGVYNLGIVKNQSRNKLIIETALEYIIQKKTVLIMVTQIEHGEILTGLFTKENKIVPFVHGDTPTDKRTEIKNLLISKKIDCAICTTVWKEGINIPSLDVVINGAGGKSEIAVLQSIGRGLRRTNEKNQVVIVDFFDPSHRFLIEHFGMRVTLYMDEGWL